MSDHDHVPTPSAQEGYAPAPAKTAPSAPVDARTRSFDLVDWAVAGTFSRVQVCGPHALSNHVTVEPSWGQRWRGGLPAIPSRPGVKFLALLRSRHQGGHMPHAYALITNQGNLTTILPLPGTLGTTASASQQDVIQAATDQRVLLHVHDGLVPQHAALAGAHRLSNTGGPPDRAHYKPDRAAVQLYLVWPTDFPAAIN